MKSTAKEESCICTRSAYTANPPGHGMHSSKVILIRRLLFIKCLNSTVAFPNIRIIATIKSQTRDMTSKLRNLAAVRLLLEIPPIDLSVGSTCNYGAFPSRNCKLSARLKFLLVLRRRVTIVTCVQKDNLAIHHKIFGKELAPSASRQASWKQPLSQSSALATNACAKALETSSLSQD